MALFARSDTSILSRWWWTIDRWTLLATGLLLAVGMVLIMAASPAIAEKLDLSSYYFFQRQTIFLIPALVIMFAISLMPPLWVRRVAFVAFGICILLLVATLMTGNVVKGSQRWLYIAGFSLQPSEFIKPCFVVITAWALSEYHRGAGIQAIIATIVSYLVVVGLLLLQPDFGQSALITMVWISQLFLAGLPFWILGLLLGLALVGSGVAYAALDHVQQRVDRFLDPASGDNYQIDNSLEAIISGGLFGRGPGEGVVKTDLPDAHSDFIFAVAGEEFGALACLFLVGLFAFVILRGFSRLSEEGDFFIFVAAAGLLALFGFQAFINIGVNLSLLPAKGMTLPFISYGGSSLIAVALGMGMLLALTRRRAHLRTARQWRAAL